jgi:glycosyltransferase involved in cell wall biosynthesis
MAPPRVSIIIPTYNQSKYIVRAIESALSQDYPNLEIIISDDNSPDETDVLKIIYFVKKIPELDISEIPKILAY